MVAQKESSDLPQSRLKPIKETLDQHAVLPPDLLLLANWISQYYLAPLGEVCDLMLPVVLRQGGDVAPPAVKSWQLTELGRSSPADELNRAPLQLAIIKRFMQHQVLNASHFKDETSSWRQALRALIEKGWVSEHTAHPKLSGPASNTNSIDLNTDQQTAFDAIRTSLEEQQFSCTLLHGVTGSGKTEVYFAAMEEVLSKQRQVLLLVPEIGLTPQLMDRIAARFSVPVVSMHSALNDRERHIAWWHAANGDARIIVGTRSAIFSPFNDLGLIVVDEEHDASYKQQDGVRYQARDVAIFRAKKADIPIILGSATPALETYANAQSGKYQLCSLNRRATDTALPRVELVDLNLQPSNDGLSPALMEAIKGTLANSQQVMLFLNRRGFAPVLYCAACKQTATCHRCDSHLTIHRRANRMRCHHCGYEGRITPQCDHCKADELVEVGDGTQRVEEALTLRFPDAAVLRIDRDSTRRKGELEAMLGQARDGDADIIVGTQLITKGHDFPNIGLVGVLDVDQGLYSTDFRAPEHLFQQLVQVSGRAGRRDTVGRVVIQTRFPDHPLFESVRSHDFNTFAQQLLTERRAADFPPFGYFALIRAESPHQAAAMQFLRRAKQDIQPQPGVMVLDAVPAPMERRAGRYRAQLLITAEQRSTLHTTLQHWLYHLSTDKDAKKRASSVRWSLDIDPQDFY
ncbi:primosomal protein N' [Arenicella chitinivorans]|uniref:Replication restart protein PriA n=1 Tax=Arenicella chitinivorans TaxID=1329800 RepID=A0A918S1U3_9GAMM|nr:primosomal protein N' [Arenicella chitinivorans]